MFSVMFSFALYVFIYLILRNLPRRFCPALHRWAQTRQELMKLTIAGGFFGSIFLGAFVGAYVMRHLPIVTTSRTMSLSAFFSNSMQKEGSARIESVRGESVSVAIESDALNDKGSVTITCTAPDRTSWMLYWSILSRFEERCTYDIRLSHGGVETTQ